MRLRLISVTSAGVLLAACSSPGSTTASPPVVRRQLGLMGTRLELEVRARDRRTALAASEAAVRALEAAEARLSTWRSDSELAALNAAPPGQTVPLSPELAAELAACARWSRATDGAFDPVVGALVAAWDLRGGGREPAPGELAAARAASGLRHLCLEDGGAVRRHPRATLEEGAWGKGAGLDAAARALAGAGAEGAFLDLGGQILLLGQEAASVAVAHPRHRDRPLLELRLLPGRSLATSGNSERAIRVGGRRRGHLLDPRTGRPAPDFGSLVVEADSALAADCLSTGLYVLGPEAALAWAASRPDVEVLVLEEHDGVLRVRATPGLARRCRSLVPGLVIQAFPPPTAQN